MNVKKALVGKPAKSQRNALKIAVETVSAKKVCAGVLQVGEAETVV